MKEQEDRESSAIGVGLAVTEWPQMATDALDQAASRGAHFVVTQALGLDLEIGASRRVIELRSERLYEKSDQRFEIGIGTSEFLQELGPATVDLRSMVIHDCRKQALLRAKVVLDCRDVSLVCISRDLAQRDPIEAFEREELLRSVSDF